MDTPGVIDTTPSAATNTTVPSFPIVTVESVREALRLAAKGAQELHDSLRAWELSSSVSRLRLD